MNPNRLNGSREAALARLDEFVPRADSHYTAKRNYDLGPNDRRNVSGLSPYIRHRILLEQEAVQAVYRQHKPGEVEKFVEEVLWRTYWKGWLEARPQVWLNWKRSAVEDALRWKDSDTYQRALRGETGIEPFDAWNAELLETGTLHNHARMWFASIWLFTLSLPWTLGAAHFFRHLLDSDPASNTLSWRWVAGLHTVGKHYIARASNIEKFTLGRFRDFAPLSESPQPVLGPTSHSCQPIVPFPEKPSEQLSKRHVLLVTADDLAPEIGPLSELNPELCLLHRPSTTEPLFAPAPLAEGFRDELYDDLAMRLRNHYRCEVKVLSSERPLIDAVRDAIKGGSDCDLVYHEPQVGPSKESLWTLTQRDVGLRYFPVRRAWDSKLYPFALKGFTQFKKSAFPLVIRKKGYF